MALHLGPPKSPVKGRQRVPVGTEGRVRLPDVHTSVPAHWQFCKGAEYIISPHLCDALTDPMPYAPVQGEQV